MVMTETATLMLQAVQTNPCDETTKGVAIDALQEAGIRPLTAKKIVNKLAREAAAAKRLAEMQAAVHADNARGQRLRSAIRRTAGLARTLAPISVVPGSDGPTRHGEAAYHTFHSKKGNGGICEYPGAAIRKGYKVDYHPSTLEVTVGAEYVARMEV